MPINSYFNETELAIFTRQSGFEFCDYHQSPDGEILAIDNNTRQLFIGTDILKRNIHDMNTVVSATVEEDSIVHIVFVDNTEVCFRAMAGEKEAIATQLSKYILRVSCEETKEIEEEFQAENYDVAEVYSRLINTGRSNAIGYLVSETGMSVKDATEYVNRIEKTEVSPENDEEKDDILKDFNFDGCMSHNAILGVVKELMPGEQIHMEYKPFIGRLKSFDAKYCGIEVDIANGRYFSLHVSAANYKSLMEDVTDELYEYMNVVYCISDDGFEKYCPLKRVKVLRRI